MAEFEITAPDGRKFIVSGDNAQGAYEALAQMLAQEGGQPARSPEMTAGLAQLSGMTQNPPPPERGWGDILYDNVIGNPDDGVTSYGEGLGSWLNRAGESMTLGIVGDEASALATGLLPGRTYDDELARYRGNEENLGTWGRLSADVVGGLVPALTGIGAVGQAASLPGRVAVGAGLGAGAGLTQGFMEGEGGFGNRAISGGIGTVLGGAIGGALPFAAELGRSVVSGARNAWRNRQVGSMVGDALGVSPDTGKVAAALLGPEDQAAMAEALRRAGPDAMLADASGRTVGALDTVLQTPVPGATVARDRIADRAALAGDELLDALRGGQEGPFLGPIARERAVNAANSAISNPAYAKAYGAAIDYATPEGAAIEELLSRIPPRHLKKAIDAATDRMIYDGMPPQVMATIAEDGSVSLTQMPSVIQLDYLKRAFDEIAEDGKDALTGKMTADGAFAARVARDIREATKAAVPEYAEALEAGAMGIRQRTAIRDGAKLLDPGFTPEQAASLVEDATEAEKRLIREGLVAQIENRVGNVRAVASDRNVDAREAAKAWADLTSTNSRRKLEMIFGDEWPAIEEQINRAGAALGLRADVSSNSRTFGRLAANDAIGEVVTPSAIERGRPVEAAQNLVSGLIGASPEAIARAKDRVRSELAELLTRQGGAPQQAISAVAKALAANPYNFSAGGGTALGIALGGAAGIPAVVRELARGTRQ